MVFLDALGQKAIYFKLETVTLRDGSQKVLKRPYVLLMFEVLSGWLQPQLPRVALSNTDRQSGRAATSSAAPMAT